MCCTLQTGRSTNLIQVMVVAIVVSYILVANGLGHYFLKMSTHENSQLTNCFYAITGYSLFLTVAICATYLITLISLKNIAVIMALHFVVANLIAVIVFRERLTRWSIGGVSSIVIGTILFYIQ